VAEIRKSATACAGVVLKEPHPATAHRFPQPWIGGLVVSLRPAPVCSRRVSVPDREGSRKGCPRHSKYRVPGGGDFAYLGTKPF
jgi:hypothetical protein